MTSPVDPLAVGQRMVAVLDDGRRTGTYKLAVAVALLDLAVESAPADPDAKVPIDLDVLTVRVMEQYWGQLRPFEGHVLRQSSDGRSVILKALSDLRDAVAGNREIPLETAKLLVPVEYESCVATVKQNVVRFPLKLLQNVGTSARSENFLYDEPWLGNATKRSIREHDNQIWLLPGVAPSLSRLAPLLKPAFQLAWAQDVRSMNSFLADEPDVAQHLFGADRVSLARPAEVLAKAYGLQCFYCSSRLRGDRQVDHVLPWSRVGLDGLANLVLACAGCNLDKSNYVPAPGLVERAMGRGRESLQELADGIDWPSQYDRVGSAARGIFTTLTSATPVWHERRRVEALARIDFVWPRTTHDTWR